MTPELWWAIGAVIALFIFTRWGLPALGWRRDCCGGNCATKEFPADQSRGEASEEHWSKTQPFTETTVQIPPDRR